MGRVKSGQFQKDIGGGDFGAKADAAEYKKRKRAERRKKRRKFKPKYGSATHVLKKGEFPAGDAHGFAGFDDFYAAVAKNPKAAKLLKSKWSITKRRHG